MSLVKVIAMAPTQHNEVSRKKQSSAVLIEEYSGLSCQERIKEALIIGD